MSNKQTAYQIIQFIVLKLKEKICIEKIIDIINASSNQASIDGVH